MATTMVRQTMFNTGEVDQTVWKRTDIDGYLTAAQSLLNMECGTTALAKKRKGFRFASSDMAQSANVTAYAIPESQTYEFIDKNGNYYLLLSGNTIFVIFTVDMTTGDITFLQELTGLPYMAADLFHIDYSLDNDSLILVNQKYPPARIYISNYVTPTFAYQALLGNVAPVPNIYPLPVYDFGTIDYNNFVVTMSSTDAGAPGSTLTFTVTGTGAGAFTTAWIGGQILGAGQNVTQPIGYAIITNVVAGVGTTTFTAIIQIPINQVTGAGPFTSIGSQFSIRQPIWSADLGYPGAVAFYQNRVWYGATPSLPTTVAGSKVNAPLNFDVGAGNDVDAIVYTIGQTDTGKILFMNGGKQLEIYCTNFEFACPQDPAVGLTPGTFAVRQQSSYGCSPILKPTTYLNDSYFASKTGSALINFHFDGIGLTYKSSNISMQSLHLMKNPFNRALKRGDSQDQDNFIYFANSDNKTITSFQFVAEYKLAALTPVVLGYGSQETLMDTDPTNTHLSVYDITVVNNQIYILAKFDLSGEFTIQIMDDAFRMDMVEVTPTVAPFSVNPPLGIVTGLDDFNGYFVNFVFNNQDFGGSLDINGDPAVVTGGTAYVYNPIGAALTGAITAGILYEVDLTPMYIFAGALQSNYYKFITKIYVDYYLSLDFQIDGQQVPFQFFNQPVLTPQTGTQTISTVDGYNQFNTFTITQNSPFDLQILGIAYQVDAEII